MSACAIVGLVTDNDAPTTLAPAQFPQRSGARTATGRRRTLWSIFPFVILGLLLISILINVLKPKPTPPTPLPIQNPPIADVDITACTRTDIGPKATLRITNSTAFQANYVITVAFLDASGTQVDTAPAVVQDLAAGQSAVTDALSLTDRSFARCQVTSAIRR